MIIKYKTLYHRNFGATVGFKDENGRDWFGDLTTAALFHYNNPEKAIHELVMERDKGFALGLVSGIHPGFISKEGVRQLALHSVLPNAQEIKDWLLQQCAPTLQPQRILLQQQGGCFELANVARHYQITLANLVSRLLENKVLVRIGTKFYFAANLQHCGFGHDKQTLAKLFGYKPTSPYPFLTFQGLRFVKEVWRQKGDTTTALVNF